MEKHKLKIAIIDDGVNIELIHRLIGRRMDVTCLQAQNDDYVTQPIESLQVINHGTICTSILLEALSKMNILDYVEVISISILDERNQHNLQQLSDTIQWGINQQVDLISLSIGSKVFASAAELIEISKKAERKNMVIVAAAANDGVITYPACLPSVIGVRVTKSILDEECVYGDSLDGINIQISMPELEILKILEQDFGHYLPKTNSLLVPVVVGQIASIILEEKRMMSIEHIKEFFAKKKKINFIRDGYRYPLLTNTLVMKNIEENEIPIIAFGYHPSNKNSIEKLASVIQQELLKNEYNCACVSDMLLVSCFEKNWFKLPLESTKEWINFYANFLNVNIIIVISEEERLNTIIPFCFIDAIISERKTYFNCPSYHLKLGDIDLIATSLFRWIMELFTVPDECER